MGNVDVSYFSRKSREKKRRGTGISRKLKKQKCRHGDAREHSKSEEEVSEA